MLHENVNATYMYCCLNIVSSMQFKTNLTHKLALTHIWDEHRDTSGQGSI